MIHYDKLKTQDWYETINSLYETIMKKLMKVNENISSLSMSHKKISQRVHIQFPAESWPFRCHITAAACCKVVAQ